MALTFITSSSFLYDASNKCTIGLGALVSPLIATQFSILPVRWRLHYLSSLGLAGLSFALILFAFGGKAEKDLLPQSQPRLVDVDVRSPRNDTTESAAADQGKDTDREFGAEASGNIEESSSDASGNLNANAETWGKMTRIMRNRAVHALAMWAFLYTGTEVSLGG
jgi:hypothetical protein